LSKTFFIKCCKFTQWLKDYDEIDKIGQEKMLNDFDVKEILLSIRTLKFENNQIKKYLKLKDEDIFKEENESDYIELDRTNLWKRFKNS